MNTALKLRACKRGHTARELTSKKFNDTIINRIYNQIQKADIIISDMTGKNPNVFYETGYAHALKKKVILLVEDKRDIPFDLEHYTHLEYNGNISKLIEKLVPWLVWSIDNPEKPSSHNQQIEYFIHGQRLVNNQIVDILQFFDESTKSIVRLLQIDVINRSQFVARHSDIDVAVVIESYTGMSAARLQDGRYWHRADSIGDIYPGSLRSIKIYLEIPHGVTHCDLTERGVRASLKEISKYNCHSIDFIARLVPREVHEFINHSNQSIISPDAKISLIAT